MYVSMYVCMYVRTHRCLYVWRGLWDVVPCNGAIAGSSGAVSVGIFSCPRLLTDPRMSFAHCWTFFMMLLTSRWLWLNTAKILKESYKDGL